MDKKAQLNLAYTRIGDFIAYMLDVERITAGMILIDYQVSQCKSEGDKGKDEGENAVLDLFGFYLWCAKNEKNNGYIASEISHDLGAIKDKWIAPRTAGYREHIY